jgi:hypothetical protein
VEVIDTKVRKANVADPDQGRMKKASKGAATRRVELNETKVRKANVAEPDEGEGKERREKKISVTKRVEVIVTKVRSVGRGSETYVGDRADVKDVWR